MVDLIKHLSDQVPIVRPNGTPTPYFARLLEEISDAKISASVVEAMGGDPGSDQIVTWDESDGDLDFKSLSDVLDFIGSATHGDILYRDSAAWARLAAGTSGQVLQTNGAGADPSWVTPSTGSDGGVLHIQDQRASGTGSGNVTSGAWRSRGVNTTVLNSITSASHVSSTVTITIASPGVVSWTAHGLAAGTAILLKTTGALPTGLAVDTVYYVVSPATDTFSLSATPGGAAINTSGAQSGTHTAYSSQFILPAGTYDIYTEVFGHQTNQHQGRLQNITDGTTLLIGFSARSRDASATDGTSASPVRGRFTLSGSKRLEVQQRVAVTSSVGSAGGWGTEVYQDIVIRKV